MRPDMILDNGWASRGQKSRFKSSLPTGTDGKGREAALAATEGGGEGLPQGGDRPRRAGDGDRRPPVTWWLYICSQATDRLPGVYKSPHYHNGLLPRCISRLSHHKDYCLLLTANCRTNQEGSI